MKYFFTTLAINEPYFENSIKLFCDIHSRTEESFFNILTSQKDIDNLTFSNQKLFDDLQKNFPRVHLTTLESFDFKIECPLDSDGYGFTFNVNMKCLSLTCCFKLNINFDYVFFIDGDWSLHTGFSERKVFDLIQNMELNGIDFGFERPARIGDDRINPENSFFRQKIHDYNISEIPIWDEAHVCNEQLLVFKNNWKLKVFVQKWEQMMRYSIANKIKNYAEGFEIGICALESKMTWNYYLFPILRDCFKFYPKYSDNVHIRF